MRSFVLLFSSFLFFLIVIYGCKKSGNTPAPSHTDYSSKMGGVRLWSGSGDYTFPKDSVASNGDKYIVNGHSYLSFIDSSYSVQLYGGDSIIFLGNKLYFSSIDSIHQVTTYGGNPAGMYDYSYVYINYYYLADSIVYVYYSSHHQYYSEMSLSTH